MFRYGLGILLCAVAAPIVQAKAPKLSYSEHFIQYSCEMARLDARYPIETEYEKWADAYDNIRRKYEGKIDNPYPSELQNFTPQAFELAEFLLTEAPCAPAGRGAVKGLSRNFRCRLDKVIMRDRATGQRLEVTGAKVNFVFIYDEPAGREVEEKPRPLSSQPWRIGGSIQLRGALEGRTYRLVHEWTAGSPPEIHMSKLWAPSDEINLMRSEDLPTVTSRNAGIFAFRFSEDSPASRDEGPLRDFNFEPYLCRS